MRPVRKAQWVLQVRKVLKGKLDLADSTVLLAQLVHLVNQAASERQALQDHRELPVLAGLRDLRAPKVCRESLAPKDSKDHRESEANLEVKRSTLPLIHIMLYCIFANLGQVVLFNECEFNNGGCDHICVDTYDGYCCMCRPGFEILPLEDFNCACTKKQRALPVAVLNW